MTVPVRVLFLCIHNSARSQMAEGYLKKFGGDKFFAESAGLESGKLNPFAVEAMSQHEIDISSNTTKSVHDFIEQGKTFQYVITVCDEANAARCPVIPGQHKKIQWGIDDPSSFTGTNAEKLQQTIIVRNQIRDAVLSFIKTIS